MPILASPSASLAWLNGPGQREVARSPQDRFEVNVCQIMALALRRNEELLEELEMLKTVCAIEDNCTEGQQDLLDSFISDVEAANSTIRHYMNRMCGMV